MKYLSFFLLLILIFSPAGAVTVSSLDLKWTETAIDGPVSHVYTVSGTEAGRVEFSPNLQGICTAEPEIIHGSGDITVTCQPATVYGYARITEPSTGMVSTGVRVPISLSLTSDPAIETPVPTPEITLIESPAPAAQAPPAPAPVHAAPTPAPAPYEQNNAGIVMALCGVFVLALAFLIVMIYDWRRG